jgi:hypothetical protein
MIGGLDPGRVPSQLRNIGEHDVILFGDRRLRVIFTYCGGERFVQRDPTQ